MKSKPPAKESGSVRWPLPLLIVLAIVIPFVAFSAPAWWTNRSVLNGNASQDFNAVNLGQLKNMAAQAAAELNADLPGTNGFSGAGSNVDTLISVWNTNTSSAMDFNAANLGQLKTVAKPFYDRLIAVGYTNAYPWVSTPAGATNDFAMANIGQMKFLFSFDLTAPTNQLPNWWASYYFGTTNVNPTNSAPGGTGMTILQAYQLGLSYYQGAAPNLLIVGGNNQNAAAGSFLPQPLTVQVLNSNNIGMNQAPVIFSTSTGVLASGTNTNTGILFLTTDTAGMAQISYQLPTNTSGTNQIIVTAGSAIPLIFNETVTSTNTPSINFQVSGGTTAPASLTLTSTITSTSMVTNIAYYEGQHLLGSSTTTPYSVTITNVTAGLHIYTAIAMNSGGYIGQTNVNYSVAIPPNTWANCQFTNSFISGFYVDSVDQLNGTAIPYTNSASGQYWLAQVVLPTTYGVYFGTAYQPGTEQAANNLPMASFGVAEGGSPLYTGNTYIFAVNLGGIPNGMTNFTLYTNTASNNYNASDFQILVYNASQFTNGASNMPPIATNYFSIPHPRDSNWSAFQSGGLVTTNIYTNNGCILTTTVQYNVGGSNTGWVTSGSNAGAFNFFPLIISHTASGSSNYYMVNYRGVTYDNNGAQYPLFATNYNQPSNSATYGLGYTLDFTNRPAWVSRALSVPSFQGQPLPPAYTGMSLDQLLQVSQPVTNQFSSADITNPAYTNLDNSPELRTNPVLDKFISDMGSNPIVLANFVLNRIHLSDGISYNAAGSVSDNSINEGGFDRSATATFLEREGNPAEQCALLIYFLRRCGVPCAFVFPNYDTLQMLDARMSSLLHFQISEVQPNTNNTPQILPVNYPWVAAYDTNSQKWVHIFPWMKDTEITEGDDLSDYMPSGYQTGLQWAQHYLFADTNILNLSTNILSTSTNDDTLRTLYPIFVANALASNGMSTNDVGITIIDRPHNYAAWSNFPQPWGLAGSLNETNFLTNLGGTNLIPGLGASTNIFDTLQVTITRSSSTNPILNSGVLRMTDLHNRLFFISTASTNNNSNTLSMYLEPIIPAATNALGSFAAGDPLTNAQSISSQLLSTDSNNLSFNLYYTRLRQLTTTNFSGAFLGVVDTENYSPGPRPLPKGDSAVLCLDYGQITQQMLDVTAQKFWAAQQSGTMTANQAIGIQLQLMGMSFYKHISELRNEIEPFNKIVVPSFFGAGLAKLYPQFATNGLLPNNGLVSLRYPQVDMFTANLAYVGNENTDSGSGFSALQNGINNLALLWAGGSAEEHTVLNQFFGMSNSASTVHLLYLAAKSTNGIITLTSKNYTNLATNLYSFNGTNQSLQSWATQSGIWSSVVGALTPYSSTNTSASPFSPFNVVYITPAPQLCASNTFAGMGAFVLNQTASGDGVQALISSAGTFTNPPLMGGNGAPTPIDDNANNVQNYVSLNQNADASYTQSYNIPSSSVPTIVTDGNISENAIASTITAISNVPSSSAPSASLGLPDFLNAQSYSGNFSIAASGSTPALITSNLYNTGAVNLGSSSTANTSFVNVVNFVAEPVDTIRGNFYDNEADLTMPGPFPVTLSRNYSSLNTANNEFGYSWKLGTFAFLGTNAYTNLIYAAEMDGSVLAYSPKSGSTNVWIPTTTNNPFLCNQKGDAIGSTANPFNNQIVLSISGGTTNYTLYGGDGSVRNYLVTNYPIGTIGSNAIPRQRPYLTTWTDAQSNSLTFRFGSNTNNTDYGFLNRITANNGNFLQLDYDTYGHIIQVNAADGRILTYGYDTYGDLVSVIRPDNSSISYSYQHTNGTTTNANSSLNTALYSTHLLIQENKPAGRLLINTYDGQGRVTAQQARVGANNSLINNAIFSYSTSTNSDGTLNGTTTITDANNGHLVYSYTSSQLTSIADQNSNAITQSWYTNSGGGAFPRSLHTRTDKRGLTTTYSYDTYGNLLTTVVTGNITATGSSDTATTTTTYAAPALPSGNPISSIPLLPSTITESDGHYDTLTYGNSSLPYLATSIQKYSSSGGGLINSTAKTYTSPGSVKGLLQQIVQDGATKTFTYNNSGWPASETDLTGSSDPSVTTILTYNLRGELIQKQDSIGRIKKFAYDDLGNKIWDETFDQSGNLIDWHSLYYNQNSELEWTEGARFNPADITMNQYDAGGRQSQHLVWRSMASGGGVAQADVATTTYTHDGYGNLTSSLDANGNTTTMGYDPVGQMTNRNLGGFTEKFTYTAGGDVSQYVNRAGGNTTTSYSQTGWPLSRTNPDSTVQSWTYLLDGRVASISNPDGSTQSFSYNDANHTVTANLVSGGGTITQSKTTDARGNLISQTDGNGYTSSWSYDSLNRVKSYTGPSGASGAAQRQENHSYDAAGVTDIKTDAAGNVTVTSRDAIGRITSVVVRSGGSGIRSRSYSYSPDHQSVTSIDGANTAVTTTSTDLAGKPLLIKKADGGVIVNTYDDNENLISTVNELGYTTSYSYDALNRQITQTLPDTATVYFGYDALGDLTSRTMPGTVGASASLIWNAGYDNAGRKLSEYDSQGGSITRSNSYTYLSNGVSGAGKVSTMTDPRGIVSTYGYDGFSRVNSIAAVDSSTNQLGVTLGYTYDNDNQPTQIAQSYQNTSLSPSTTVNRSYDPYGNIATEQVSTNGVVKDTWSLSHDALGHRTGLTELNNTSFPYTYQYRGDGMLTQTTFNGGTYTYSYGTDGLLVSRSTPVQNESIIARDVMGRITEVSQNIFSTFILDEKPTYNLDGTQSGYTATRNSLWNTTNSYYYDNRARLGYEFFYPASGLEALNQYTYDGAGALGVRTTAQVFTSTNNFTNHFYVGYIADNSAAFARLSSFQSAGVSTNLVGAWSTNTTNSYDNAGNQLTRVPSSGTTGANDTLTYDALGRLIKDVRTGSSSFTWTAVYDGLGRRLQTTQGSLVIQSSYDPEAEFLEIAVTVNGARNWFVHGPDSDGTYGGLQGTGGVEAVYNQGNGSNCAVLNDVYGNAVASVTGGSFAWNGALCTAFGPSYSVTPVPINAASTVGSFLNYKGHAIDGIGTYHFGTRELDAANGKFTQPDPLGHAASWDLYTYCGGDGLNRFDMDGRLGKSIDNGFTDSSAGGIGLFGQDSYANYASSKNGLGYAIGTTSGQILGTVNGLAALGLGVVDLGLHKVGETLGGATGYDALMAFPFLNLESVLVKTTELGTAAEEDGGGSFVPDEAWSKNAPHQVTPGTRSLEQSKYNQDTGELERSEVQYDQYGRQVQRTDYTNHGYGNPSSPDYHSNPHVHEYEYGPGYGPKGKETRTNL